MNLSSNSTSIQQGKAVTFHFLYTLTVPPQDRKRKPTTESQQGFYTVAITEVADNDALIAIIEELYSHSLPHSTDETLNHYCTRIWRWYQGHLWIDRTLEYKSPAIELPEVVPLYPIPPEEPSFYREDGIVPGGSNMSLDERIQEINQWATEYLVVDGAVYKRVLVEQEPRYVIETNHRRQCFQIKPSYEYRTGTAIDGHYRIDNLDELNQVIDQSFYCEFEWRTEWLAEYQILIPEALQLDIKGDAKRQEEERFESNYRRFCGSCDHHFFIRDQQIIALKRRLAELCPSEPDQPAED